MTERKSRSRPLSDEEIDLWLTVARTVVARRGSILPEPKPKPASPPPAPVSSAAKQAWSTGPASPAPARKPAPPPLAPFEKRYRQKVTRGRVEIEAAIDLHGLNQAEAHQALHGFLVDAWHGGARLVLVVTGKGRARGADGALFPEREPGVLRRAVPNWLRAEGLRPLVMGFEEAGLPHGGLGALYVRLRKRLG